MKYTEEELKILYKPVGELTDEEYKILSKIFEREGFKAPIIIRKS